MDDKRNIDGLEGFVRFGLYTQVLALSLYKNHKSRGTVINHLMQSSDFLVLPTLCQCVFLFVVAIFVCVRIYRRYGS